MLSYFANIMNIYCKYYINNLLSYENHPQQRLTYPILF